MRRDDYLINEDIFYPDAWWYAFHYDFLGALGQRNAFYEHVVKGILSDAVSQAGDGEFYQGSVEVESQDVVRDDGVDNAIGYACIDVQFYVVFGLGCMPADVHDLESQINNTDLLGTRVNQIEARFEQS